MTGGFQASAEALSDKSKEVAEIGASIHECVTASDEMGVGGLVYGVFFDPSALPFLSSAKDVLSDTIGTVADGADQISANLQKNADTYSSVEAFLKGNIGGLQTDTGGGGGGW